MFTSFQAIEILGRCQDDVIVVHNMSTSREWPVVANRSGIASVWRRCDGQGHVDRTRIALARPDRRVWVLDGDGSLLMSLGALVTIAAAGPANFVHFVFENGVYEVTGGQKTPGAGTVDFAAMARAAGYPSAHTFDDAGEFERAAASIVGEEGPVLVDLRVKTTYERSKRAPDGYLGMPILMARLAASD